jgi:hypothetical protein
MILVIRLRIELGKDLRNVCVFTCFKSCGTFTNHFAYQVLPLTNLLQLADGRYT